MSKAFSEAVVIDLGDYTKDHRNLTSRVWGIEMSRKSQLNRFVREGKQVVVKFPPNLSGVNTLFLEEFFETTVETMKPGQSFSAIVTIENDSLYNVPALVDMAVRTLEEKKASIPKIV